MITVTSHGGGCCGAKHIYSFNDAEERNPDLINKKVSEVINGQSIEVILNGGQVERFPTVLARLAHLGFVLTDHWRNGNHGTPTFANPERPTEREKGTHNYRFVRCDRRERLLEGPIAGRWAGMVNHPGLDGYLRPMNGTARAQTNGLNGPTTETQAMRDHFTRPLPEGAQHIRWAAGRLQVGARVRVNSPTSTRHGREFVITGGPGWDNYFTMDDNGTPFRIIGRNLVLVVAANEGAYRETEAVPGARVIISQHNAGYTRGRMATLVRQRSTSNNPGDSVYEVRVDDQTANGHPIGIFRKSFIVLQPEHVVPRIAPMVIPQVQQNNDEQRHNNVEVFEGQRVQEAAPANPVVVFQSYHNVYRDNRRGAGYDTLEGARGARRGNGRIDRREVFSDGTTRFVEDVNE